MTVQLEAWQLVTAATGVLGIPGIVAAATHWMLSKSFVLRRDCEAQRQLCQMDHKHRLNDGDQTFESLKTELSMLRREVARSRAVLSVLADKQGISADDLESKVTLILGENHG